MSSHDDSGHQVGLTVDLPVPVHVANAHEISGGGGRGKPLKATPYTIVLGAGENAVQQLLPEDPTRRYALVQAFDDDVVVCTKAQARAAANQATGLPAPAGWLLAKANTSPVRIDAPGELWVTNDTSAGRISVLTFCEI